MRWNVSRATNLLLMVCLVAGLGLPWSAGAESEAAIEGGTAKRTAIRGYDPVAYYQGEGAVKGRSRHRAVWRGAEWHFSSRENLQTFLSDPESYAPAYDGYCAWGMTLGERNRVDPKAFLMHEGRVYLFYSEAFRDIWKDRLQANLRKANRAWRMEAEERTAPS